MYSCRIGGYPSNRIPWAKGNAVEQLMALGWRGVRAFQTFRLRLLPRSEPLSRPRVKHNRPTRGATLTHPP